MSAFQELVADLRRFRSEHQISPKVDIKVLVHDPDGVVEPWWGEQIAGLAGVSVTVGEPPAGTTGMSRVVAGSVQAFVPLAGIVDIDAERTRVEKNIDAVEETLRRSRAKLDNPSFRDRAPAEVVAGEESKAVEAQGALDKLRAQLAELG